MSGGPRRHPKAEPAPTPESIMSLSISRLMLAVAGVAGLLGLGRVLGYGLVLGPVGYGGLIYSVWLVARLSRRWAAGMLVGVAGTTGCLTAWLCVHPVGMVGEVLPLVVAVATSPAVAACVVAWFSNERPREVGGGGWPGRSLVIVLAGLPGSMAVTLWPLHLAFEPARRGFDRLADQVAAVSPVAFPRQVGVYLIVGAKFDPINPWNVALYVDANPNHSSGFARTASGSRNGLIGSSNYAIPLGGGWEYRDED